MEREEWSSRRGRLLVPRHIASDTATGAALDQAGEEGGRGEEEEEEEEEEDGGGPEEEDEEAEGKRDEGGPEWSVAVQNKEAVTCILYHPTLTYPNHDVIWAS